MVDVNQGNIKEQVENVVREVINKYHFLTFTEYKAVLTKFSITAEEVKGSHYGNSYSGIVYSATDNDDNKVGNPFSAATLGKFARSEALERKYRASKEYLEKSRPIKENYQPSIRRSYQQRTVPLQLVPKWYRRSVSRECSRSPIWCYLHRPQHRRDTQWLMFG